MAEQRVPWLLGLAAMAAVTLSRGGSPPPSQPSASALTAPFAEAGQTLSLMPEAGPRTNTWAPYRRLYQEFLGEGPLPTRRPELRGSWGEQRISLRASPPEPEVTPKDLQDIRDWAKHENYGLDFMVALVPDPIDSRLPSSFDLTLAGLQLSLSQSDYILDRQWLPWVDSEVSRDSGQERVAHQAAGMMLFRRVPRAEPGKPVMDPQCVLALFLVGETPARGIHKEAFSQAVGFISGMQQGPPSQSTLAACRPPAPPPAPGLTYPSRDFDEIRVMGPSYSGSTRSLRTAIRSVNAIRAGQGMKEIRFRVVTGTATARALADDFKNDRVIDFSRTVVPDDILTAKAYTFMKDRLKWDMRYSALLTEDDTVYGQQFPISTQLPLPSGLSAIRNAWEKSEAAKGADREPVRGRQKPALDISLADPGTQADGVRELSPLTSRIDEMAMANLLNTISRYGIRYVGIVATDVKDEIFLAQQIRRWSPDVILFLFESNLIYLHPQAQPALFGSLAITCFPLTNSGLTVRQGSAPVLMFGSEVQEGVYRATQCLLEKPMAPPAVWFAATGSDTMSPVAEIRVTDVEAASFMNSCPRAGAERTQIIPFPESNDVQLLLLMIAIGVMACWLGSDAYLPGRAASAGRGNPASQAGALVIVRRVVLCLMGVEASAERGDPVRRARALLILGEVVLCLMGAGLLALALLPLWARGSFFPREGLWGSLHPYLLIATGAAYGGLLLCLAQALGPNAASAPSGRPWRWPLRLSTAIWVTIGGCLAYLAIELGIRLVLSLDQPGFFYLRARRFANGLSPFVPLGWLGAAFFAWLAVEMKRQQVSQRYGDPWPLPDDEPALAGCTARTATIKKFLAPIWPRGRAQGLVVTVAIVIAALLWQTAQPLADPRWYGRLFVLLALFGFLLSVASFYRFLRTWRLVRDVLRRLEHCNCRPSFAGIAGTEQWHAMKSFVWHTPSFRSLAQAVEGLKALGKKGFFPAAAEASRAEVLLTNAFKAASDERFADEVEAREGVARIVHDAGASVPSALLAEVQALRAYRVVGYLQHVFNQMRYALIGAMVPALLLIGAISSYTFVPSHYMTVLFWAVLLTGSAVSLMVFMQMDRDVILSEIGNTAPGKVTFDRAFLSNIFTYAVLPLLALISSQVPEVSQLAGRWLDPLTHLLEVR